MRIAASCLVAALVAAGCSGTEPPSPAAPTSGSSALRTTTPSTQPSIPTPSNPTPSTSAREPLVGPDDLDVGIAVGVVRHLAGVIGPRHGTSPAFRRAVAWVTRRFEASGLVVRRQRFDVPGGDSWGVPVPAGSSWNVVAAPPRFRADRPHLVLGAHLDTVPQAPGAEDNASGVGVLLAIAEALDGRRARLPVVLVAFGAEEPRGATDDDHHYGSRAYVASLSPRERRAVRGMLALDRVGVGDGDAVPVGAVEGQPTSLVEAARRTGIRVAPETGQRSSDHWSFVRAGLPGLRVGGAPYAAYHSEADVPAVVAPVQLARVGRLVLGWLRS